MKVKKSLIIVVILVLIACFIYDKNYIGNKNEINNNNISGEVQVSSGEVIEDLLSGDKEKVRSVTKLDIEFLKLENQMENKIYSPLSIKYALKMLEVGASGNSKLQISNVISDEKITKYNSNSNMSTANALFILESFKENIKKEYIKELTDKFGAEVIFDSFTSKDNVNSWVSKKTLNLIKNLLTEIREDTRFILVNALGIDMEWQNKFLEGSWEGCHYEHENFWWSAVNQVTSQKFGEDDREISGMEIKASLSNYDIIADLGEENIRQIVSDEFRKWARAIEVDGWDAEYFNGDLSDENIENKLNEYLDYTGNNGSGYMNEIASNYGRIDYSTNFSLYVDDTIKVFAKDLKEYEGTTLQYIGIMPINENLDKYIEKVDEITINKIISNLKDLKLENFKDGVITRITGYIPKFKFEYELDFIEDLKKIGITDVFEEEKAALTKICDDESIYITDAKHKANIEFTQDGIKAAAATILGGGGAGEYFNYIFDVPVEEIDLTFDKPYMFLIRDKENGETWFVGTVYEPMLWEDEPEKNNPW